MNILNNDPTNPALAVLEEKALDSGDETRLASFSIAEVSQRAKEDMNFLAKLCLPDVCSVDFPPLFLGMWGLVIAGLGKLRDFSKFALGLPRGHGKTTVLKLLIIWAILFSTKRFILIVGSTKEKAENIVADVCDILDSENILGVFGNWRVVQETDRTDLKKFKFRGRDIILAAVGTSGSLRGLNIKNSRPDMILCDDMQTKEEAESEQVAKKLLGWFVGTLMKAKNPRNCTFLYIGNMYPDLKLGGSQSNVYACILRNLQNNPSWISWIVGGVLGDGKALWEEVQPLEQLLSEFESDCAMGCPEVFFAEVQNDPMCGGGLHFDISKLPKYEVLEDFDIPTGRFLLIDPSLGKKKSDAQIVGEFNVYDSVPHLVKVHIKQVSAPDLVDWVVEYASKNKIPLVVAESVAYQGSLLQWFDRVVRDKDISGISFQPISPGGRAKNARILSLFKELMAGTIQLHPFVLSQVLSQISTFDPTKTNNTDDILDVIAYSSEVVLQYYELMLTPDIVDIMSGSQWEWELSNAGASAIDTPVGTDSFSYSGISGAIGTGGQENWVF